MPEVPGCPPTSSHILQYVGQHAFLAILTIAAQMTFSPATSSTSSCGPLYPQARYHPPADLSLPRSPPSDVDTNTLRCSGVTTISTGSFECESVCLFWSPRLAPKSVPKMSHTHPKFKAGQCVILIMLTYWYKSVLNTFLHRSKSWCSHRKVWIHLSNTFLYAHGIQKIAYKCSCCFKHMTRYTAQGKIHSDR